MNRSGHSMYKSQSQSVQCTRPSRCLRQQWRHNPIHLRDVTIATQRTFLWVHVNVTEIVLKSKDWRSNLSLFLYAQGRKHGCLIVFISRVIRRNDFSKTWHISLPCILRNNGYLQMAGVIRNDGFRVHYIVQCTVYNARWRNNALQTMLWMGCNTML